MKSVTVEIEYIPLVVSYDLEGKHYHSTRDIPTEYPELTINKVRVIDSDMDIQELLSKKQMEYIVTKIWEVWNE